MITKHLVQAGPFSLRKHIFLSLYIEFVMRDLFPQTSRFPGSWQQPWPSPTSRPLKFPLGLPWESSCEHPPLDTSGMAHQMSDCHES